MPFVDGSPLWEALDQYSHSSPSYFADCRLYIGQIADALQHLHAMGLVHGDLKPENIMVAAKNKHLTLVGLRISSCHSTCAAAYLSPERAAAAAFPHSIAAPAQMQPLPLPPAPPGNLAATHSSSAAGEDSGSAIVTAEDDMWALGVILKELMCGERGCEALGYDSLGPASIKASQACTDESLFTVLTGLLSPPATRFTSAGLWSLLGSDFVFSIGDNCFSMVALTPADAVPLQFDRFVVISVPMKDRLSFTLASYAKATHSVLIAMDSRTNTGLMLEYTDANKVFSTAGRLVRRGGVHKKDAHYLFSGFSTFCEIAKPMPFSRLQAFNNAFRAYGHYHLCAHNCHSYHRSLIASAYEGKLMYNFRTESKLELGLSSHKWIGMPVGVTRAEYSFNTSNCRYYSFNSLLKPASEAIMVAEFMVGHDVVLTDYNMSLPLEDLFGGLFSSPDQQDAYVRFILEGVVVLLNSNNGGLERVDYAGLMSWPTAYNNTVRWQRVYWGAGSQPSDIANADSVITGEISSHLAPIFAAVNSLKSAWNTAVATGVYQRDSMAQVLALGKDLHNHLMHGKYGSISTFIDVLEVGSGMESGLSDETINISNLVTGVCIKTLEGHRGGVNSVCALGLDQLASGSVDASIKIWNHTTGVCIKTLKGHGNWVTSVCALGLDQLASGSYDKSIKIWNLTTGVCIKTLEGHGGLVRSVCALGLDQLASGSWDKSIKIWNLTTGVCIKTLEGHGGWVRSVCALGLDQLASGSDDKSIKIWNRATGVCIKTLEGHGNWVSLVCALGLDQLASGSYDKSIKIWNRATGVCIKTLKGHGDDVTSVCALGLDQLASGSHDKSIKIWNLAAGVCIKTLEGHGDWVRSVCALGLGQLGSGSVDSSIKIWNLTTGQ